MLKRCNHNSSMYLFIIHMHTLRQQQLQNITSKQNRKAAARTWKNLKLKRHADETECWVKTVCSFSALECSLFHLCLNKLEKIGKTSGPLGTWAMASLLLWIAYLWVNVQEVWLPDTSRSGSEGTFINFLW